MVHDDSWQHAMVCEECRAKRWERHRKPQTVFGIGPSHREYWKKEQHEKFGRDMDAYREARRNGLQPEMVTREAVEKAERLAYRQEKLARRVG